MSRILLEVGHGGVHSNNGVLNKAAYLIARGGSFNGCSITGIGQDKEEAIFYRALTNYLTTSSGFNQAYAVLIRSCNDLYHADDCLQVTKALKAVELDQPGRCSGIARIDPGCGALTDQCPSDPNKVDPGGCGCGVAETGDTDLDGVLDCNDACANDPGKVHPGGCGCGIADTDTDKDATPDCNDQCPNDPAKTIAGICGCGTPDSDTDQNGILDCHDFDIESTTPKAPIVVAKRRSLSIKMEPMPEVAYRLTVYTKLPRRNNGKKTKWKGPLLYESDGNIFTLKGLKSKTKVIVRYIYARGADNKLSLLSPPVRKKVK